ncbi:MAG TPA: GLPGLI family protein, partial [Chitinophagaceae bacterium]
MRTALITIWFLFMHAGLLAQTQFLSSVKIEFEKTVYVRQLSKDMEPEWYDRIKDRIPETALTYFNFMGDTVQSIYRPGREIPADPRNMYQGMSDKNIVYNNYRTQQTITQKPVFEEIYLVEDSLTRIRWKLTADVRNIAGFECRKAIGLLEDSI